MTEARPEAILPGQRMTEAMSTPMPANRGDEDQPPGPADGDGAGAGPAATLGGPGSSGSTSEKAGARRRPESTASLRAALEAVLLVVDEPVSDVALAQVVEEPRDKVTAALRELAAEYTEQGRGFDLREVAGGWRLYTRSDYGPVVERFVRDGRHARLTQAALETLAVVAYRQPVSRVRVSAVRGVNVDAVMRTLVARGLVEEAGTEHETGAILYRTTSYFLERLGLRSLDELPELAPFLPAVDELDTAEITESTTTPDLGEQGARDVPEPDSAAARDRPAEETGTKHDE
jgi:segregation and condensation protein B